MDASNKRHPFEQSHWKKSEAFRGGELDGREPLPFPSGFSLLRWIVFHSILIS